MKEQEKLEEFINSQPKLGTKEFNDLASAFFGGNPKQETLEEAAERFYSTEDTKRDCNFIEGAKWQQERSYSEEEVLDILIRCPYMLPGDIKEWFNKIKKK